MVPLSLSLSLLDEKATTSKRTRLEQQQTRLFSAAKRRREKAEFYNSGKTAVIWRVKSEVFPHKSNALDYIVKTKTRRRIKASFSERERKKEREYESYDETEERLSDEIQVVVSSS